jgi:hypothetical protein
MYLSFFINKKNTTIFARPKKCRNFDLADPHQFIGLTALRHNYFLGPYLSFDQLRRQNCLLSTGFGDIT